MANRFENFADAQALFTKGDNCVRLLGRLWLHKDSDYKCALRVADDEICILNAADVLTFTASPDVIVKHAHALMDFLHLVSPMMIAHSGRGMFRIDTTPRNWYDIRNTSPKYVPGIRFDLKEKRLIESKNSKKAKRR